MRKWLLVGLLMLFAVPLSAQQSFMYGGSPNDTGKAFRGFAVELAEFRIKYDKLYVGLHILTRGANDSLTVTIQTRPTNTDTLGYRTLKQFLNLVATADTSWSFGAINNASDTLRLFSTFARITVNHGNNAAGSLDADSSRFRLLIRNWGNEIAR